MNHKESARSMFFSFLPSCRCLDQNYSSWETGRRRMWKLDVCKEHNHIWAPQWCCRWGSGGAWYRWLDHSWRKNVPEELEPAESRILETGASNKHNTLQSSGTVNQAIIRIIFRSFVANFLTTLVLSWSPPCQKGGQQLFDF